MFKYELLALVVTVLAAAWFAFGPSMRVGGFGNVQIGGFFKEPKWKWARVLGSIVALYAVVYFLPSTHWWVSWVWIDHNWWLVLLAHGLLAWAYLILPDNPKKPADLRFAGWVATFATVLLLATFGFPEYVGNPLMEGKKIQMTWKGYLPRFKWVDVTPDGSGNNNAGGSSVRLPISPSPIPLNEAAWREDLGFWMGHVATRELTQEEAEMMAAHCVAESKGCNQFEADKKTPMRNTQGSSAVCKYQIMLSAHADILKKFENGGKGDYVDVRTADGCRNFAYELVMSNKARKLKYNVDWASSESDAKKFLEWAHSVPPDSGDPNLRNKNAPLIARGSSGTLQTPPGWKPGDPVPNTQSYTPGSTTSNVELVSTAQPKGQKCKEVRIEAPLPGDDPDQEQFAGPYKLGYHPFLSTGDERIHWRMVDQDGTQIGQINGRQQHYFITQSGVKEVYFQTYKSASDEEATATIFLTPCSMAE